MPTSPALADQRRLIDAFAAKLGRMHGPVREFETHISRVLVTGEQAWKFKKAVHTPFLDFSTLEKRRRCCEEELRLNRRLAPEIYLSVEAIGGPCDAPVAGANGAALEYAVQMRAFSQDALWSERLRHGRLAATEIDDMAQRLADFHRDAAAAIEDDPWATPEALDRIAAEIFDALMPLAPDRAAARNVARLRKALGLQAIALHPVFLRRRSTGRIRECHGDLHCGNVVTIGGRATAFDCIEFNDSMRWIDVMNDLAFLYMDLSHRGRADFAARLLNAYLECSGDYDGLRVLRYYRTLRALIRCMVAWLRASQLADDAQGAASLLAEGRAYLEAAQRSAAPARPAIVITHGPSGSGKSTLTGWMLERLGAVRLRSDVERKRLHGLASTDRTGGGDLYDEAATRATYARLEMLTAAAACAGFITIVDAAFLDSAQRKPFRLLAARLRIPFFILDLQASGAVLRERVAARAARNQDASDAGVAVLATQLARMQPLDAEEAPVSLAIDAEADMGQQAEQARASLLRRMRAWRGVE